METYIACWEWGKYLGEEALAEGVDVCVSSWTRIAPNTLPALAKAGANYMNSQLIRMEAHLNGYAEGIALDTSGYVSEGSGRKHLRGARRQDLNAAAGRVRAARHHARLGDAARRNRWAFRSSRRLIPREMLYIADEVFFSGTAAEITPIRSVDRITVGKGSRGPVAEKLQKAFFGIVHGDAPDKFGWLTPHHKKRARDGLSHGLSSFSGKTSDLAEGRSASATPTATSPEINRRNRTREGSCILF